MNDIKIFKKCKKCGHWLTLMESYREPQNHCYVGVRCLNCGWPSFTELWKVYKNKYGKSLGLQENPRNPFLEKGGNSSQE